MFKFGFIGYGNLGKAFASGAIRSGLYKPSNIVINAKSDETRERARTEGIEPISLEEIMECEYICLLVKKHIFFSLGLPKNAFEGKKVISFAAGMTIDEIKRATGNCEVTRVMPTLSIADLHGVLGYTKTDKCLDELLNSLGYAFEVPEDEIEKVTAYSACGLGFAAYLIDAYLEAGLALGFDREQCEKIADANFKSALAAGNYADTVRRVATKGGATEAGINLMERERLKATVADAVRTAYEKMM